MQTQDGQQLRVALVGLGHISRFHIAALHRLPFVQLVAGCDVDKRRLDFAQTHTLIGSLYTSLSELLRRESPDVVHVTVPPPRHAEAIIECLRNGSHVFAEKPIAISSEECRQIRQAEETSGRLVGINHNLLWHPGFLKLTAAIRHRRLGAIRHVSVCYSSQGKMTGSHWAAERLTNPVLEQGPHPLSLITSLLGNVCSVDSRICRTERVAGSPVITSWQASLVCDLGPATCFVSFGDSYPESSINVLGEDGWARVDLRVNTFQLWTKTKYPEPIDNIYSSAFVGTSTMCQGLRNFARYCAGLLRLDGSGDPFTVAMNGSISAFYLALLDRQVPPVSSGDAAHVVAICEQITERLMVLSSRRIAGVDWRLRSNVE